MTNINLIVCDTVDDYKLNRCDTTSFKTSKLDFIRHAITLGNLSSYSLTPKGERYYVAFVDMFFDGKLGVRNDVVNSETSLMVSHSFLMGMIITKDIAEKRYNIATLFHLKDELISVETNSDRNYHPDYFGFNKYGRPFLFEAKGRKSKKLSKSAKDGKPEIDRVKNQLLNVDITWDNKITYLNIGMKKHIIQSIFSPNLNVWDIDPPSKENKDDKNLCLEINMMKIIKDYYKNIFELMLNDKKSTFRKKIEGINYILINRISYSIGIREDVHENLSKINKQSEDKFVEKHYELINKDNVFLTAQSENISVGLDGIIIKEN